MDWKQALNRFLTPRRQRVFLLWLVIIYAFLLSQQIDRPFIGDNEELNGMNGISAANWLYHGPMQLKFAQVTLFGPQGVTRDGVDAFYLHHPNFLIAPLALSYWLFGIGEWQTRIVPIIFSLLALMAFWFLTEWLFKNPWLTVLSSLLYVVFPTTIYYGRLMTHEPINIFFILLLYLSLISFEEKPERKYLFGICAAAFLGMLTDWPFTFAIVAAFIYVVAQKAYPQRSKIASCIAIFAAIAVAVTLFQVWAVTQQNPVAYLKGFYVEKHGGLLNVFSLFMFLFWRAVYDSRGFTDIGLILAVIGAIFYIRAYKNDKQRIFQGVLFLLPGLLTYILFYPTATTHQFSGLYFAPLAAIAGAYGIGLLRKTWLAGAICAFIIASSAFYAMHLFSITWFTPDDFALVKRVGTSVPEDTPICIDGATNTSITFYLYPPHRLDAPPCAGDKYFLLQNPEGLAKRPSGHLLQNLFASSFGKNVEATSILIASVLETIKSVPPIERRLANSYRDTAPTNFYANLALQAENFIKNHGLQKTECSTDFCFYKTR